MSEKSRNMIPKSVPKNYLGNILKKMDNQALPLAYCVRFPEGGT